MLFRPLRALVLAGCAAWTVAMHVSVPMHTFRLLPPPLLVRSIPSLRANATELRGLVQMARLNTVPSAIALVGFGARAGGGGVPVRALPLAQLALAMTITALVTSGSMIINDYYDFRSGVDTAEHAQSAKRALVRGDVRPETAKLLLKWLYALTLTMLCLVDSKAIRLWILANALLTYVYSVHLKPLTGAP
jgi:4-hydroxybenzoate polyprenyltransferase